MKETFQKLLNTYGATGREETVADVIEEMIRPYVDEIHRDAMGNLIAVRHGQGKRILYAAHMDHIGFIVTDIDEKGFLRVHNVGGVRKLQFSEPARSVRKRRKRGVFLGSRPGQQPPAGSLHRLYRHRREGSCGCGSAWCALATWRCTRRISSNWVTDMLAGPAMDNRAGCCVLIETLKALKQRDQTRSSPCSPCRRKWAAGALCAAAYAIESAIWAWPWT